MSKKAPMLFVAVILCTVALAPYLCLDTKRFLYAVSLNIKSVIVLLLPFIIFGILLQSAVALAEKATTVIGLILVLVCCSNFLSTLISYFIGIGIYSSDLLISLPKQTSSLSPMWEINLPQLISNDMAMLGGVIAGILLFKFSPEKAVNIVNRVSRFVHVILTGIIYAIPFFIIGCIIKLDHDEAIHLILKSYSKIFVVIILSLSSYILLLYFILNKFRIKTFASSLSHMAPAVLTALSSMSSAAAMPLTIIGTQKNSNNKNLANAVIPATVNIHLIGDCFAIPILAYAILKSFGIEQPTLGNYLIFAMYFVLAKFSVAAIPGGGILVMLPILEKYLFFHQDMLAMITALYILFDPVITSFNVLGNGAFGKLIDSIITFFERKKKVVKEE